MIVFFLLSMVFVLSLFFFVFSLFYYGVFGCFGVCPSVGFLLVMLVSIALMVCEAVKP